jgi:hypothetical protein
VGLGAAIGALVTERAWELPAVGASLRERWRPSPPDLGCGKGELSAQVTVAAPEFRVAGDEPVVLGRSGSRGSGGGPLLSDLASDVGVATAEGGVREVESAGQHQDAGPGVGLPAGLQDLLEVLADQCFGKAVGVA